MRSEYRIDLSEAGGGLVRVAAEFRGFKSGTPFSLPVLGDKPGVKVIGLRAENTAGKALRPRVSGETVSFPARDFKLEYSLRVSLEFSIGTDKDAELLYPFLNSGEVFLGSGALPYPKELPRLAARLKAAVQVAGMPAGWRMFASLEEGEVCPGQLDSFFMYFSAGVPGAHIHKGLAGRTELSLLVQKGKTIPLRPAEIWRHTDLVMRALETNFDACGGFKKLSILILQPPADFEKAAANRTFATGENVPGGIAVYTPKSAPYIRRKFGYESYAYLLRDGLAHELTHLYSTTSWQGRCKSRLFPSENCPPRHKRLIGEVLTAYFHNGIMLCRSGRKSSFISAKILPQLAAYEAKPRKIDFLDLFLLDLWLREGGSSLKDAVRVMLKKYGSARKPYGSARALTQAAASCRGPLPSWLEKSLLTDHFPDYPKELAAFAWENAKFEPFQID